MRLAHADMPDRETKASSPRSLRSQQGIDGSDGHADAFAQAEFFRGTGLGNRLFPWARAFLFARRYGLQMLAPKWQAVRRGPLLRGGALSGGVPLFDVPGKIWLLGNFGSEGYVSGLPRQRVLKRASRISESDDIERAVQESLRGNGVPLVVTFRGDGSHFKDLVGEHDVLRIELIRIARHRPVLHASFPIALNVRLGRDFRRAEAASDFAHKGGLRTPVEWFARSLVRLRSDLGDSTAPALVVSDGADSELAPLLRLPNVHRFRSHYAVADLLALAGSRHLIGSGGSSFTAWAGYLGQSRVVTVEGQSMGWFGLGEATSGSVETWPLDL